MNLLRLVTGHRPASVLSSDVSLAAALIGLDAVARLVPHAPGFTPVVATALFAGAVLRSRSLGVAVPVAAMALSDLVLGAYDVRVMGVVYAAILLPAVLGFLARRFRLMAALPPLVLLSSLLFFVATNFAVWLFGGMYAHDLAGLISCYVAALPFLKNQILGDLFWMSLLLAGWWITRRSTRLFASPAAAG